MVWFGDGDLRRLAGARSYERGVGYVGAVGDLDELPDGVVAVVHGTEPYRVRLRDCGGSLDGDCTCPHSQEGAFCKHCVAVGLVLLADAPASRPKQRRPRTATTVDLRGYLSAVDPAELVALLLDLAADDPALHRRLSLRAATHGTPDVKELRRLVGSLRARGYLDYARSFDYARTTSSAPSRQSPPRTRAWRVRSTAWRSSTSRRPPSRATTRPASSATRSAAPSTGTRPPAAPRRPTRSSSPPG